MSTRSEAAQLPAMVFGLFGVGVTQPLLDLYGRNPEVFIANRSSSGQIVTFALLVAFLPAVLIAVPAVVARMLFPAHRRLIERVALLIAGFFAASALLADVLPDTNLQIPLALLVAGGLAWSAVEHRSFRLWLTVLAVLPLVVLGTFFVFSDSGDLIGAAQAEVEETAVVDATTPVVMVMMDELPVMSLLDRDGSINGALFPNFERLAAGSTWFRNAASNSIATADSVPITLSGRLNEGAAPTSADNPDTLFTLLGGEYDLLVEETVTMLCPDALCGDDAAPSSTGDEGAADTVDATDGSLRTLLDDARIVYGHVAMAPLIHDRLPSIDGRWGDFVNAGGGEPSVDTEAARELPAVPEGGRPGWMNKFLRSIDRVDGAADASFHYTHIIAPHIPWTTNPSGSVYPRPEQTSTLVRGVEGGFWIDEPAYAIQGFQRHLSQLGAVDRLLGLYLDELERSGVWDDAVVVVTADHGGSFEPGAHRRWVMGENADELYRVPLFVRAPGLEAGAVRDEPVFSLDIVPTIVDALDIEVDWELEGTSLLGDIPNERVHVFEHFTGDRVSLDMDLAALDHELAENYAQVPDTESWLGVAAVGPHASAVGRTLDDIGALDNDAIVASVDGYDGAVVLDVDSGVVPTVLTGRVTVPSGWDGADVLVSVNGTVRGAGFGVRDSGDTFEFSAYVPESSFSPGENDVAVLLADPSGVFHVSATGDVADTILVDGEGNELVIVRRGQKLVQIDRAEFDGDTLVVRGFGADTGQKEPPDRILLYYGDELVYDAPPNQERSDVPVWHDSENLRMTGFFVELPADRVPADLDRITAVAQFDDQGVVDYATLER